MEYVGERDQPRDFQQRQHEQEGPLGPPSEVVWGGFLIGALVLCLDLWVLGVLAVRWLA